MVQLKEKCKQLGLTQGGVKADLVKRILEKEAAPATSAPEAESSTSTAAPATDAGEAQKAEAEAKAAEEAKKKAEEQAAEEAKKKAEAEKAAKAAEEAKKAEAEKAVALAKATEEAAAARGATEEAVETTKAVDEANLDPAEKKRRAQEAKERQRKADKKKKLKEKKKATKAEELKDVPKGGKGGPLQAGKGGAKGVKGKIGKGQGPLGRQGIRASTLDDEIEVDYIVPEVLEGNGMDGDSTFAAIMERFKYVEPEKKEEEEEEEDKPKKRTKPKASLLEEGDDSEDERDLGKVSKKKRKVGGRMSVAELKTLVKRPDVVEIWDTTSADPRLLVYLKAYRNTVTVPKHWNSKRKYMAGKRGVEKPPFKLPEFIEATGIAKIRQSILDKQAEMTFKQKSRARVHPKIGKLDIDYQVLHDAFFKFGSKTKLTKHNDLYFEGKEYETKMMTKRPGQLSAALKEALGMEGNAAPPPWLINMQRYGPPPAYPNLKIPGLNAPIPQGAEYGYHPGGWGKPPVDEFGNPLYGDWKQDQAQAPQQPEDVTLWGELEDYEEEEEDDEPDAADRADGTATPMLGTATPLIGTGSATPVMSGGVHSISGVSSLTSGMDTPTGGTRSKRGGIASVSGISSASLTPTPQLFQVLEEQKSRAGRKGVFPSSHTYKMGSRSGGGSSTPIGGVGSSGTGTPLAGIGTPIGGIGTPIGGIGTPHGISTPHGIGTPGLGTRTPHGISTPLGVGSAGFGTGTPGQGTPGIGTPMGGIGTPHVGGIATPIGGIATPVGGIATPIGGIATPVGGIATPIHGVSTPAGIATPVGGIATPTGLPGGIAHGGTDTPGPVTMSLNPEQVETEGILTADIIRQQLKQHEEAAARAKLAAGQREVDQKKGGAPAKVQKKRKDKSKFKF